MITDQYKGGMKGQLARNLYGRPVKNELHPTWGMWPQLVLLAILVAGFIYF